MMKNIKKWLLALPMQLVLLTVVYLPPSAKAAPIADRNWGGNIPFPYDAIVEIVSGRVLKCQGVMIDPQWVLTSSNCLNYGWNSTSADPGELKNLSVNFYSVEGKTVIPVQEKVFHPKASRYPWSGASLAMLKLSQPAPADIKTINFPPDINAGVMKGTFELYLSSYVYVSRFEGTSLPENLKFKFSVSIKNSSLEDYQGALCYRVHGYYRNTFNDLICLYNNWSDLVEKSTYHKDINYLVFDGNMNPVDSQKVEEKLLVENILEFNGGHRYEHGAPLMLKDNNGDLYLYGILVSHMKMYWLDNADPKLSDKTSHIFLKINNYSDWIQSVTK